MQTKYALLVALVAVPAVPVWYAWGQAAHTVVVSQTNASTSAAATFAGTPALSSNAQAGIVPVGVATRLVRKFPSLTGQFGFRNATLAMSVMADEGLAKTSARHALRVGKIEQSGGAWRAALPQHAEAAADAGRRGVGTAMYDEAPGFDATKLSRLQSFGEADSFVTPKGGMTDLLGWISFSWGGKTKKIGVAEKLNRWMLRRSIDRLSDGQLTWLDTNRFNDAFVDRTRRTLAGVDPYPYSHQGSFMDNTIEHFQNALAGGPQGKDVANVRQALHAEMVRSASRLAEQAMTGSSDEVGAYLRVYNRGEGVLAPGFRFDSVHVQHASDLQPNQARVTIAGRTENSHNAKRLRVEIGENFSDADALAGWTTQQLENHDWYARYGRVNTGTFNFAVDAN